MDKEIIEAVDKALKDYGVDWIMEERGDKYSDVLEEIIFALEKVIS